MREGLRIFPPRETVKFLLKDQFAPEKKRGVGWEEAFPCDKVDLRGGGSFISLIFINTLF